jgi:hypothetical protein
MKVFRLDVVLVSILARSLYYVAESARAMLRRENKLYIKRLTPAKPITFALTRAAQKLACFD